MRVLAALLIAVIAVAAACSPEDNPTPSIAGTSSGTCLTPFRVDPSAAIRHPGDTLRVIAVAVCELNFDSTQIHWSTSDTLVARVDSLTGLVLALARGTVTVVGVSVAVRSVTGTMVLSVVP